MRRRRRATAMAILQGLIQSSSVKNVSGILFTKHSANGNGFCMRALRPDLGDVDSNTRRSRSTGTTTRRNKCAGHNTETTPFIFADGQSIEQILATEGAEKIAELLVAKSAGEGDVFFNRVGGINRDLSVLMANVLAEEKVKDRLQGNKRKKRRVTPLSSLPADGYGAAVGTRRPKMRALFKSAFQLCSRGWRDGVEEDGGNRDAKVLAKQQSSNAQEETPEEEEDGLVILDAFAASGVRSLRYMTEVPGVQRVVANDFDATAIERIRQAANLCGAGDKLEIHHGDAMDIMYAARAGGLGTYDVVDIDPFGCAGGFLDAGVQAVSDGGLLCVTSTDMPILSGVQPEVAWARYGSVPTRSGHHHEMSLRILLHAVSAAAGRHRRSIQPVLSVAIDHYVRVFVRVSRSRKAALAAAEERTSYVLQSEDCSSFFLRPVLLPNLSTRTGTSSRARRHSPETIDRSTSLPVGQPPYEAGEDGADTATSGTDAGPFAHDLGGVCPETGGCLKIGGPIWSGPLHDDTWVTRAITIAADSQSHRVSKEGLPAEAGGIMAARPRLAAGGRVESLLQAVSRELPDVPLFYNLRDMFATLGLKKHPRREQVMGALEAAGYRTSGMHKEPLALKTDAPDAAVWDVLRCWARDNPQPPPLRTAGKSILGRDPRLIAVADFEAWKAVDEGGGGTLARGSGGFLHTHNPEKGWGPLAKRSTMNRVENEAREESDSLA